MSRSYTKAELEGAKKRDQWMARRRERLGGFKKFGDSGRLHMQVDLKAVFNAVQSEGREVLTQSAKSYWEDQKRLYPWIDTMPNRGSSNGMRNRFGRVTWRKTYGNMPR
jgi:hypothetical protein